MSVPTLKSMSELVRRFERGDFDLVAVGRALLADPNWLQKVPARRGRSAEALFEGLHGNALLILQKRSARP
jgi:2,4-dienoyl-CoA reductase-like NADH-dependent reductase (Old Yellow Enzyme family)